MTDTTAMEQERILNQEIEDNDYTERNQENDNGKEKDDNETWAMVAKRGKKNGIDARNRGTEELQKSQGKQLRHNTDGRRAEDQRNETMKEIKTRSKYQRDYKKEATLTMTVNDPEKITVMMIIKTVEEKTGVGKLFGLRKKSNFDYELTMENQTDCDKLKDGLLIDGQFCKIKKLCEIERMVSFLLLPNYIKDDEIIQKLVDWGVSPIFPLRRRYHPGTTVADGTRFLRVKFPQDIVTLPYNVKFDTEEGPKYFRVIHDDQLKTCRICASTDHEKKDCPKYTCRDCLEQGHFARDCQAPRCQSCEKTWMRCMCESEEEGNSEMETEVQEQMEETSSCGRKDDIKEVNEISEDLCQQEKEVCMRREDNRDKEMEVHMTETEIQQTTFNDGQIKETKGATLSETEDGWNKETENKEEDDDGVKDSANQEEVRDGTFDGKESVKKNILSGGSRLKTPAKINIEKVMEKQRIRRESKEKKKKKKAEMTGLREEEGRETEQK